MSIKSVFLVCLHRRLPTPLPPSQREGGEGGGCAPAPRFVGAYAPTPPNPKTLGCRGSQPLPREV